MIWWTSGHSEIIRELFKTGYGISPMATRIPSKYNIKGPDSGILLSVYFPNLKRRPPVNPKSTNVPLIETPPPLPPLPP